MNFIKKWNVGLLSMLPALAMAHPGHDHAHSGLWQVLFTLLLASIIW